MIDCSNQNIWYNKRRRRQKSKTKRLLKILIVFAIIFSLFGYYKCFITQNLVNICNHHASSLSTTAVNNAIIASMNNASSYNELIDVQKNSSGDIIYMSANSYKLNNIRTAITKSTKTILDIELEKGINIPFLAFLGIDLISGFGTPINYKVLTLSSVKSDFVSEFTSVGINQTLHSIYIKVNSEIHIDIPLHNKTQTYSTNVLLCETILVGKVPEIYLNGKLFA